MGVLGAPTYRKFSGESAWNPRADAEESPLVIWQRVWRAATMRQRRELLAWLQQHALPEAAESQKVWP